METELLKAARAAGCAAYNGIGMLVYQGVRSIAIWSGIPAANIPAAAMERAVVEALLRQA
jgi:shikimate dehydrogenase